MEEKLMSVEEVAAMLNLSEEAVRKLVDRGELPAYKIGGVILRFKKEQVETYCRRLHFAGTADAVFSHERAAKGNFASARAGKKRLLAGRGRGLRSGDAPYTLADRIANFLYYNDFYILSLILLILVALAVFQF